MSTDDDPISRRVARSYLHERAPLRWGESRPPLAVCVVVNVESFDNRVAGPAMAGVPGQPPDLANATWREYGNRVGVWRLFRILEELEIPATVAQNSGNAVAYPAITRHTVEQGWELIGHGELNNHPTASSDRQQEESNISRALTQLTAIAGSRPRGWLSPGLAQSAHTLDLLSAARIAYVADWVLDEQPVQLTAHPAPLVAFPYTLELNDFPAVLRFGLSGAAFAERIHDQYEQLRHDATESGRIMTIALHPFITGVPHRARHLRTVLERLRHRTDVWFATAGELVDRSSVWLQQCQTGDR